MRLITIFFILLLILGCSEQVIRPSQSEPTQQLDAESYSVHLERQTVMMTSGSRFDIEADIVDGQVVSGTMSSLNYGLDSNYSCEGEFVEGCWQKECDESYTAKVVRECDGEQIVNEVETGYEVECNDMITECDDSYLYQLLTEDRILAEAEKWAGREPDYPELKTYKRRGCDEDTCFEDGELLRILMREPRITIRWEKN